MNTKMQFSAIPEQQNKQCFRHILENIEMPVVTLDSKGTILFCNKCLLNLTGWQMEEVMNQDWFDQFVPPELRIISRKRFLKKMGDNAMPTHTENEIVTRHGVRKLIVWDTTTYSDDENSAGMCGTSIGKDVTDIRMARLALQKSEETYRTLVSFLPAVVFRGYLDWSIELIDNKIETLTGYSKDEFESGVVSWKDLVLEEDRKIFKTSILQAIHANGNGMYDRVYRVRHKSGNTVWVHTCGQVVVDDLGRIESICGAIFDITEQKQIEERFFHAQKMEAVGRLAGGVAHDFNNLLTVMLGYSDVIRNKLGKTSELHNSITQVIKAGEMASILTKQLLTYSRKQIVKPVVLDINQSLLGMENILKMIIVKDIDIKFSLGTEIGEVLADLGQLEQILMNLAVNASDAMSDGGVLTIKTSMVELDALFVRNNKGFKTGSYILLEVSDNGSGMDQETVSRIFEPFFTTKSVGKGTGLGLSTVYAIVRQKKGHIKVQSEPGIGTTFKIYLPKYQGEVAASFRSQRAKKLDAPASHHKTVLVVENSEVIRLLTSSRLREFGFTVLEARNGKEALRIANEYQGQIHLMLTDIAMPGMSGRELALQLHMMHPDLKVLFMSGYMDHGIASNEALKEEDHLLLKPFTELTLEEKLREALSAAIPEHVAGPSGVKYVN